MSVTLRGPSSQLGAVVQAFNVAHYDEEYERHNSVVSGMATICVYNSSSFMGSNLHPIASCMVSYPSNNAPKTIVERFARVI